MNGEKLSPFGDAVAGSLGALCANSAVFPLDVIKTRLQVQSKVFHGHNPDEHYNNAFDAFVKILRSEGVAGLYAGLGAGLAGTVAQNFAYFYCWSWIRGSYQRRHPGELSTAVELLLGAAAGALSQLFTLPISVVATRQQTSRSLTNKSLLATARHIIEDEGPQGLWRGLKASLILCVNPAITYGTFERLKTILMHRKLAADPAAAHNLTAGETFMVGAIAKTLATVVTYPYIMAKVRLQWKPPMSELVRLSEEDRERIRYRGSVDVLRKVWLADGFKGWYKGMPAQIVKAVLCQAMLFVSKDQFTLYTLILFKVLTQPKQVMVAVKR